MNELDVIPMDPLDDVIATLTLGDPIGVDVPLTARMLCQNVLITGGVGSGKTTSGINPILRDAIRYRADEPERKTGLFVFDSKTDGTTERVRQWARECGREGDLRILSEGSAFGYDPIRNVTSASEVGRVAGKIQAGFMDCGEDNHYWSQTMRSGIEAALAVELILSGRLTLESAPRWLSEALVAPRTSSRTADTRVSEYLSRLESESANLDPHTGMIFEQYGRTLEVWRNLDPKTRGILISCVGNVLAPLLSSEIRSYYPLDGRSAVRVADIVDSGLIIVLRVNSAANPDLAATLGRFIKADLYMAIQNRRITYDSSARLVGLILDEYPLVATSDEPHFGDVQNLQTMREKRALVVAAAQGYVSLQNKIGCRAWEALRINLTNQLFFRSIEPEIEHHARLVLGQVDVEPERSPKLAASDWRPHRKAKARSRRWILDHGDLSRLATHEAYYALADGEVSESRVVTGGRKRTSRGRSFGRDSTSSMPSDSRAKSGNMPRSETRPLAGPEPPSFATPRQRRLT